MRFGAFVPQGWRLDLVGIDPALHWGVMDGLARRFDAVEDWESLWVYDHFHTVPKPSDEATHEAWISEADIVWSWFTPQPFHGPTLYTQNQSPCSCR